MVTLLIKSNLFWYFNTFLQIFGSIRPFLKFVYRWGWLTDRLIQGTTTNKLRYLLHRQGINFQKILIPTTVKKISLQLFEIFFF